jgi:hypothetical protein
MVLLESGPAKFERRYYTIIAIPLFLWGLWFIYDGWRGYADDNREVAVVELQKLKIEPPEVWPESPTGPQMQELLRTPNLEREALRAALGEPYATVENPEGFRGTVEYHVSLYGLAIVPIDDVTGRVDRRLAEWKKWKHSREEIQAQYYWSIPAFLIALVFTYKAYKAFTLRAVIDEEGMTYGSKRINFDQMVSLREYNPKGWVDLYYREGEDERRLRIDNQKIGKFNEIVDLLVEKKGFAHPIQEYEREHALGAASSEGKPVESDEQPAEPGDRRESRP